MAEGTQTMKIDIWETAPTLYPHARRKWDRPIFKWVKAELPGHDEADILSVVEEVYAELEKAEVREYRSERALAAFVRKVSRRRAWKLVRRWRGEGYQCPLQPLGPRHPAGEANVARERPLIGTAGDGSDDEGTDPPNENSWGDSKGIYARQKVPVPLTRAEVAKKYDLTLEEVDLLLSPERKSGKDRVRLCRLRERMKKKLLGGNENK
jgi:hypothetical protein